MWSGVCRYLGIQSKKDPAHVMSEVFRALLEGNLVRLVCAARVATRPMRRRVLTRASTTALRTPSRGR